MEIEKGQTYKFKEEFCKSLGIPFNQVDRRQKDLLEWLTNFFDYEFKKSRPCLITIKEIYGEYEPLPRKRPKQDALNAAKKQDYEKYTIAALGTEFKPNSKAKIARDAIYDFGRFKYHHTNSEAVAKRYISEPFDKYGVTDNTNVWVWFLTYEEPEQKVINEWRAILREEHISEDEAANAFYRQEQGQDISKEKSYYKRAQDRFKKEHDGEFLVLVKRWKVKAR